MAVAPGGAFLRVSICLLGRFAVTIDTTSNTGLRMLLAGNARVRLTDSRLSELALEGRYEQTAPGSADPPGRFTLTRVVTSESAQRSDR